MLSRFQARWPDKVELLRPVEYFCDDECPVVKDGIWLYFNYSHFTVAGSNISSRAPHRSSANFSRQTRRSDPREALFGNVQRRLRRRHPRPQQNLANESLRRRLEIAIGEIRRQQRRCEIDPEKRDVVERDRRSGERKTKDDQKLDRKMQEIAGIGHVAGRLDRLLNGGRHGDVAREAEQQDRRIGQEQRKIELVRPVARERQDEQRNHHGKPGSGVDRRPNLHDATARRAIAASPPI